MDFCCPRTQWRAEPMAKPEVRACITVPEGKKYHVLPSKHEVLFLLHAFMLSFLLF